MKKNIILGLLIGLIIVAISSCSIFGVGTTMSDRIDSFEDDLNGSRANIIDNIHSDAPGYNKLDDVFWNEGYWVTGNKPFSITKISEGSHSASANFVYGGTPATISFEMKDDGDFLAGEDWKIMSCTVNGINQF